MFNGIIKKVKLKIIIIELINEKGNNKIKKEVMKLMKVND